MTATDVRDALREVIDPELGINIVDLGLVYAIDVTDGSARITMTMTTPACPLRDYIKDLVESAVTSRLSEAHDVTVDIVSDPPWTEDMMSDAARRQLG
jgi:metal-sulfur cluster biosynthetic enzyme